MATFWSVDFVLDLQDNILSLNGYIVDGGLSTHINFHFCFRLEIPTNLKQEVNVINII